MDTEDTEEITDFSIPESELNISFSRSGGKGGQHVNKVETRVTIIWDFNHSNLLTDSQKEQLAQGFEGVITDAGLIKVSSEKTRSQLLNRQDALLRLHRMVKRALTVLKTRHQTSIPLKSKRARRQAKKHRSAIKKLRQEKLEQE